VHAALHRPSAESLPSSSAVLPSSGKRRRTNSSRACGLASPNLPNSFPSDMFERVVPALPPLVFDDTTLLPLSLGGQHLVSAAIPTSSGVPASVNSAVLNPIPQETYISAAAAAAVDMIPLKKTYSSAHVPATGNMPARRGFETRPPQKPPNSRESNKSYEIITKLQIKTLQERPILQTAFWPAANITNSGLAADSGPCCGYKLGGYVHTSAPAPIGSGRVAHSSVHAQYESCRNIGVRRCDKYQTNEAVDTTAEGVEIYELAAKAGPEHVEERACDHCDSFP